MHLVDMRAAIRAALSGTITEWPDAQVDRAVTQAVGDLSRHLPLEKIYDYTVDYEVSAESVTTESAHGTYKALANSPIEVESETVTSDPAGTTYVRNTDYTMDYANGKITTIDGGSMSVSTGYLISYRKDRVVANISSLTSLQEVVRVEYPAGTVPQSFVAFAIWGDFLYVLTTVSEGDRSQSRITENKHMYVYYLDTHTPPAAATNGTYPLYLDEAIILGAAAYCLHSKAVELELYAYHTELVDADSTWTALDAILTKAQALLDAGDDYIPTVNIGADVPERYNRYAQTQVLMADQHRQKRVALLEGATHAIELAARLRADAALKRAEFWSIIQDRAQIRTHASIVSVRQLQ